jgi:WD40 repeat protein
MRRPVWQSLDAASLDGGEFRRGVATTAHRSVGLNSPLHLLTAVDVAKRRNDLCDKEWGHVVWGASITGPAAESLHCAFDAEGNLITGHKDRGLLRWSRGTFTPAAQLQLQKEAGVAARPAGALCVDSTGNLAVLKGRDRGGLRLADLHKRDIYSLAGMQGVITHCAVTSTESGAVVLAGNTDGQVLLWRHAGSGSNPQQEIIGKQAGAVSCCCMSSDGLLAATGSNMQLAVWDLGEQQPRQHRAVHSSAAITCCTFSPDGTKVAFGSSDGTVRVWELQQLAGARVGTLLLSNAAPDLLGGCLLS